MTRTDRAAPSADLLETPVGPPRESESDVAVQVEAAESELRRLGLEDLRVHPHGDLARIEAPHAELSFVTSEPLRGEVLRAVRSVGFRLVAVDLGAPTDPGA